MLPFEIEQKRLGISSVVEGCGAELLEIQFRRSSARSILTFIVDKIGGITLAECVEINHELGRRFDEWSDGEGGGAEFLNGSYYLEVNSPGLDRPLVTERDFTRAVGRIVRISFKNDLGQMLQRVGVILGVEQGVLQLKVLKSEERLRLPLVSVERAVHEIQFK